MTHPHRLLILAPTASVPAVVDRIREICGDANACPDDLGPGLNVSGDEKDTASHHWCCGAFTDDQAKRIFTELCRESKVEPPKDADWEAGSKGDKAALVDALRPAIKAGGVGVMLLDNQARETPDPAALLADMGVKVRGDKGEKVKGGK